MLSLKDFREFKVENESKLKGGWQFTQKGVDGGNNNTATDAWTLREDGSKMWWHKNSDGTWSPNENVA